MTGTNTRRDREMKVQRLKYYPSFRAVSIDPSSRLQRSWRKKNTGCGKLASFFHFALKKQ
jgi:hypothetical protein